MVGILKPSLHYYSRRVVLFEGLEPRGLINLDDRLAREWRRGLRPSPVQPGASLLLVIDQRTARLPHWRGLPHRRLAAAGLYELWRLQRIDLQARARQLQQAGVATPDWQRPRPERY